MNDELISRRYLVHDMNDAIDFCFRQEWWMDCPLFRPRLKGLSLPCKLLNSRLPELSEKLQQEGH